MAPSRLTRVGVTPLLRNSAIEAHSGPLFLLQVGYMSGLLFSGRMPVSSGSSAKIEGHHGLETVNLLPPSRECSRRCVAFSGGSIVSRRRGRARRGVGFLPVLDHFASQLQVSVYRGRKSDAPPVRGLTAVTWHLIPLIVHRGRAIVHRVKAVSLRQSSSHGMPGDQGRQSKYTRRSTPTVRL